jgi:hypothetical protein
VRTSLEKTAEALEELLATRVSPAVAAFVAPMIDLPNDPAVLDEQLANLARMCCVLRSDDAPLLEVIEHAVPLASAELTA